MKQEGRNTVFKYVWFINRMCLPQVIENLGNHGLNIQGIFFSQNKKSKGR